MPTIDTLSSARLDKRVLIQSRGSVDDGGGGETVTWTDHLTVWAEVQPGSGREFVLAQQLEPDISHVVTMRYRPGITAKHRLKYESRVFPIHVVSDPLERHEQLVLYCSEVSPT